MKHPFAILISSGLWLVATGVQAQEQGRVISSTPVYQQFAVQQPHCTVQEVAVQPPKSGAGALMGAVAGGALGNAVGGGAGRAVATAAGILGGAVLGDHIEGAAPAQLSQVQQCGSQVVYENRLTGYHVVYEYGGRQYSVQLPQDPGPTLALQVSPVAPPAAAAPVYAPAATQTTVYTETYPATTTYVNAPVVYAAPTYYAPAYYPSYYPALTFGVGLGLGYWSGWRGGGWRGGYGHGYGGWHGRR